MNQDEQVGFRKPPNHSRFKKGQSGNPRGRPRATRNLKTDLAEELSEEILFREGGRSQKISRQRAIVKSLVARTVKGDSRAGAILSNWMLRLLDVDDDPENSAWTPSAEEEDVLRVLEERLLRKATALSRKKDPENRS